MSTDILSFDHPSILLFCLISIFDETFLFVNILLVSNCRKDVNVFNSLKHSLLSRKRKRMQKNEIRGCGEWRMMRGYVTQNSVIVYSQLIIRYIRDNGNGALGKADFFKVRNRYLYICKFDKRFKNQEIFS